MFILKSRQISVFINSQIANGVVLQVLVIEIGAWIYLLKRDFIPLKV